MDKYLIFIVHFKSIAVIENKTMSLLYKSSFHINFVLNTIQTRDFRFFLYVLKCHLVRRVSKMTGTKSLPMSNSQKLKLLFMFLNPNKIHLAQNKKCG